MTDCGAAAATYARGQSVVRYGPRWRHCFPSPARASIEDHDRVTGTDVVTVCRAIRTCRHRMGDRRGLRDAQRITTLRPRVPRPRVPRPRVAARHSPLAGPLAPADPSPA